MSAGAQDLGGRTVVVGVTGGIAAYKVLDVVAELRRANANVRVIMTRAATRFVEPLSFEALSAAPVYTDLFAAGEAGPVAHVALADKADVVLVAPATADFIARAAAGMADDFLTTFLLAVRCPVIVAPAMNSRMYEHPFVQANLGRLAALGWHVVPPDHGWLAEGKYGLGRLPAPERILTAVRAALTGRATLAGRTILVTAGPTREYIDPVRFISNPSSGKMGYAIAKAARDRGANVVLVSGPTVLEPPPGVTVVPVVSTQQMYEAVRAHLDGVDAVFAAAAPSDFRPRKRHAQKVKKESAELDIELERTPDILAALGESKGHMVLVGFAAETENVLENARDKLVRKHLDLMVANQVGMPGAGFESDTNVVTVIDKSGKIETWPRLSKAEVAEKLLDRLEEMWGVGTVRTGSS